MVSAHRPEVHVRTRRQLEEGGHGRRSIEALLESGAVERLGGGFYGTPGTPPKVRAALLRGNRLTCVDALELYGFWVPRVGCVHEARRRVGPGTGRTAREIGEGVVLHAPILRTWPDEHPVLPLLTALEHAVHCLEPRLAAVVLESGLNRGLISGDDAIAVCRSLSRKRRREIFPLSRVAESGTETIVRRALTRRGFVVRPQVAIPEVGRVDLLVGERLVIECDSVAHHAEQAKYTNDRRRDRAARRLGYTVVRLTYEDVMLAWDATLADLLVMLRRGDHRIPRSRRPTGTDERGLLLGPGRPCP
ncbi:endonuclease domain-containing protein [Brachybacterium sp. J153]|uniref:endonuclease domain-containing protein n=1 Tax=Brachybacterium sp. J153 TaxID=3116488 RepID=UPI002E78DEAF|nr:DUF559 domain-containing protein [Brachybacterium sp. J153]MEE1618460.1 DUF559 domain-containing protein [Brachybacterium sp. J153]